MSDSAANKAFVILLAIAAQAAYGLVCAHVGQWYAIDKARMAAAEILTAPRRAQPATYVPLLDCTSRSYLEYRRTCNGRVRAGRIGE